MVAERAEKVSKLADFIPEQTVVGPESGKLLVVTWGGSYGMARSAVRRLNRQGAEVAHAQLRYLNPFPKNLGDILQRFNRVLIPELNLGQLSLLIRGRYLVDAISLSKVQGVPFKVSEIVAKCNELLEG